MARKFLNGVDNNNQRLLQVADPTTGTDAANRQYVDALVAGLRWKIAVRAATTANSALASTFENGDTIDGVALVTGDRILIKDQTAQTENGIYTVNASGAPTRATDADSPAELESATVFVMNGTVNNDTAWTQTTTAPTIGVSNIVFTRFGGGNAYTADGNGLELVGTVFSLKIDGTSLSESASGVRIASAAAGAGLIESAGVLAVGAGTGITVNANDVAIDPTIVTRKYSVLIGNGALTSIPVVHNLGTKDVVFVIRDATSDEIVECDAVSTSTTTLTLAFNTAPTSNQYRVTVVG